MRRLSFGFSEAVEEVSLDPLLVVVVVAWILREGYYHFFPFSIGDFIGKLLLVFAEVAESELVS